MVPVKEIEYGVDGDLFIIYPKPYSIYLRGILKIRYMNCSLNFGKAGDMWVYTGDQNRAY